MPRALAQTRPIVPRLSWPTVSLTRFATLCFSLFSNHTPESMPGTSNSTASRHSNSCQWGVERECAFSLVLVFNTLRPRRPLARRPAFYQPGVKNTWLRSATSLSLWCVYHLLSCSLLPYIPWRMRIWPTEQECPQWPIWRTSSRTSDSALVLIIFLRLLV